MKITRNTILITGGSAGIGFEMAKQFAALDNHVIIVGRNADRLKYAVAQLHNVTAIQCDVTKETEVKTLSGRLKNEYPQLNILVNNAGHAYKYTLGAESNAFAKAAAEMSTNYLSVINLTEQLLPLLSDREEAAIINVSSIVAFAPAVVLPTYSASKAALHSYTKALRHTLAQSTAIKVFEVMPPLVDTAFSAEIGGANGIKPGVVAADLLAAMREDHYEIHIGDTKNIYQLYLQSPQEAIKAMNA